MYLERRFESFVDSSQEDLVKDALIAIRKTMQEEKLKSSICAVAVVEVKEQFHILDQEKVQQLINALELVEKEEPHPTEPSPVIRPLLKERVFLLTKPLLLWKF